MKKNYIFISKSDYLKSICPDIYVYTKGDECIFYVCTKNTDGTLTRVL